MWSPGERFAFSLGLACLAAQVEDNAVKRERLIYGVSDLMAEALRVVNRRPRRRRGRTKQLPLFYPLEHQIRLKFEPLSTAADASAR